MTRESRESIQRAVGIIEGVVAANCASPKVLNALAFARDLLEDFLVKEETI